MYQKEEERIVSKRRGKNCIEKKSEREVERARKGGEKEVLFVLIPDTHRFLHHQGWHV